MDSKVKDASDGLTVYQVGGFVRDSLLGLQPHDRDYVVVGSTADEMKSRGFSNVGHDFPVFLHPFTKDEYALARTERKTSPGYNGFTVHADPSVTLEEDLSRRDLTINAMALSVDGQLIDPFNGRADLDSSVLRHISSAFSEDPLRVLRVARFAARLGFTVAPETMNLMKSIVDSGEIDTLTPERVLLETNKALSEDKPSRFFEVLRDCGALKCVLPELDALFGVPQPKVHHPEIDTGVHTMMVVDQSARMGADVSTRFSSAMHDLGKSQTSKDLLPKHHGHEKASVPLINNVCDRLKVSSATRKLALSVGQFHTHAHRAFELTPKSLVKLFKNLDAIRQPYHFECFLKACEADARGRQGLENQDYPQADFLRKMRSIVADVSVKDLALSGIKGAAIGEALHKRRIEVLKGVILSDKQNNIDNIDVDVAQYKVHTRLIGDSIIPNNERKNTISQS
ncbi:MAG: multifunctional CCA addition/repair protein [Methylococcales bacterium]